MDKDSGQERVDKKEWTRIVDKKSTRRVKDSGQGEWTRRVDKDNGHEWTTLPPGVGRRPNLDPWGTRPSGPA